MDDLENVEEGPEEEKLEPEELEAEELEVEKTSGGRTWLAIGLVGLAMLLIGGLLGYVGRGQFGPEAQAAKATEQQQAVLAATQAAANADLMKFLSENTRHYKGDPNAAVTIIEFSDYQ
jgi:protein-disulfide isomerase